MKNTTKPRVFIVENNVDLRESIARKLRSAGFEVETDCVRRSELVRQRSRHTDVVITDVHEPCYSGMDVCSTLCNSHPTIDRFVAFAGAANSNLVTIGERSFLHATTLSS